jgi:hypothetical protein
MVLGTVAQCGKSYATALVDTLDYLSERSIALPPVATGANSLGSLSRRIKMLRNPAPVGSLTIGRLLLLLAVAAAPMAMAFAARNSPSNDRPHLEDLKQHQGQESFVAQADKDKGLGQPAVAEPPQTDTPPNEKKNVDRQYETWRMAMNLQASDLLPSAVQWAIFDKDPVPAFKAQIKKINRLRGAESEAAKEDKSKGWIWAQWDRGFKEIAGDRLYLLTSENPHPFESNAPDGKKWIVTKVRLTKGKPVCWCISVEVKYGEEIKVTLTEKNVFDLGAAADSAIKQAEGSKEENKKIEDYVAKTWRIQLMLRFPGSAPFEVTYAIFDEDPTPDFKASVKKWQKSASAEKRGGEGDERQAAMASSWDGVFKKIPGNHVFQLKSSASPSFASNAPDGKKWIVTKIVEIKGKPVCWCLPVEVKTGEAIKATLTEENVFDLKSIFDGVLKESEPKK